MNNDVAKLLKAYPKIANRLTHNEYGDPGSINEYNFLENPEGYSIEKHGWTVIRDFDGTEAGTKVINGHTWYVETNSWLSEARVHVDAIDVTAGAPEFLFDYYSAFELIDLGAWHLPDFVGINRRNLLEAEQALRNFDHDMMMAERKRAKLVDAVERNKAILAHSLENA